MRYSIEPRERIYVKGYGFFSFAKNMGRNANKVAKNLSNKYGKKLPDSAKKSTTDATKTVSKRAIQKTAEATGDLIANKIADKITSVSKKPAMELHNNDEIEVDVERATLRKDTYLQKKGNKLLMKLRLVPKRDAYC